MSGHSKWANIKHRKGKQDALKGKVFTKLIREITVAAKGGADIASNPRLRLAVDKALAQNMTRDTISRAIKRGAGGPEAASLEEVRYEGYASGGVAVIVDCLTDNRNRTVGDVRYAFARHGGNLGTAGSVAYLFKQNGVLGFASGTDEDKLMQVALDAGALDVQTDTDGSIEVITLPEDLQRVQEAMHQNGLLPENAELSMLASTYIKVDKVTAEQIIHLVEALEDLDDVQDVYFNAELPDEVLQTL